MKVHEPIDALSEYDPECEVVIRAESYLIECDPAKGDRTILIKTEFRAHNSSPYQDEDGTVILG